MSTPPGPGPGAVLDEPGSVILILTGVLVLQGGTGLQVLWLVAVVLVSVLLGVRADAVDITAHRPAGDQTPN
jgi:hypothetical protein